MRSIVGCALLLVACHRPTEIRGVYTSQEGAGTLFPCEDPRTAVVVRDSSLDARYRALVPGHEGVYVRLRGIRSRSGSPKGGGQHLFQVEEVLELRRRNIGECPGVATPITPVFPG